MYSVETIVIAANRSLFCGGVDGKIDSAAGRELLKDRMTLNGYKTDGAKITGAYDLTCSYVIQTFESIWSSGNNNKPELSHSDIGIYQV